MLKSLYAMCLLVFYILGCSTDSTTGAVVGIVCSRGDSTSPQLSESVQPRDVDPLSTRGTHPCHGAYLHGEWNVGADVNARASTRGHLST